MGSLSFRCWSLAGDLDVRGRVGGVGSLPLPCRCPTGHHQPRPGLLGEPGGDALPFVPPSLVFPCGLEKGFSLQALQWLHLSFGQSLLRAQHCPPSSALPTRPAPRAQALPPSLGPWKLQATSDPFHLLLSLWDTRALARLTRPLPGAWVALSSQPSFFSEDEGCPVRSGSGVSTLPVLCCWGRARSYLLGSVSPLSGPQ